MKVALIGLDGATFDLIGPWIEKGKLRNIRAMIKRGTHGVLKSVIPPISSAAWVSIVTGKNPGKHGIFDFVKRSDESYFRHVKECLVSSKDVKGAIWDILSSKGFKVGVVNVPVTYPPKMVNGFMISDFMTPPGAEFTYPPSLKDLIPFYKIDVDFVREFFVNPRDRVFDREKIIREQFEVTRLRAKAVKILLSRYDLDFFMVVFKGTDNLQHFFWNDKDLLLEYYEELDGIIGEIVEIINSNVIIVSDHGFGPEAEMRFHVNNWLMEMGYLRVRGRGNVIFKAIRTVGKRLWFKRKIPVEFRKRIEERAEPKIDWRRTVAFGSRVVPGVRINLKGREPYGVVERGRYERVREEIMEALEDLDAVDEVYRREELYSGEFIETLPDVILRMNPKYRYSYHFGGGVFERNESIYEGDHVNGYLDGILIAFGPDIKEGVNVSACVYDIAPTILHIFGLPIPGDMDGRVLKEIFREDSDPGRREVRYGLEYERLRRALLKLKGSDKI